MESRSRRPVRERQNSQQPAISAQNVIVIEGRKRPATRSMTNKGPANKKHKITDVDDDGNGDDEFTGEAALDYHEELTSDDPAITEDHPAINAFAFEGPATKRTAKKTPKPYYTNATLKKPEPEGKPDIWAEKRQQICEAMPKQYRAYQSGAYQNGGILYGFLVDAKVGKMDFMDYEIIITTVGGDSKLDAQGNRSAVESKDNNNFAAAATKSMEVGQAVTVIVGQGNSLCPSRLVHFYNVLDWFQVTDVWREGEILKSWKLRLEKIHIDQKSWWAPKGFYDGRSLQPNFAFPKAIKKTCKACKESSKHIYEQGWVCLQSNCKQYFKFPNNVDTGSLSYNKSFLQERRPFTGAEPGPLRPTLPTESPTNDPNLIPWDQDFPLGFVCKECGGCSRRTHWDKWICENRACTFEQPLPIRTLSVDETMAKGRSDPNDFILPISNINREVFQVKKYTVTKYSLPGPDGAVVGIICRYRPSEAVLKSLDGPDMLFNELQQSDYKLSRAPSRNGNAPSQILTSHFASNFGALYKYGVTPSTTPFSEAPEPILKALCQLRWAGEDTVKQGFQPFNELLLVGYYESAHMSYHDDGETTLGETVASLSLGAGAVMRWRPKKKAGICPKQSTNAKGTMPDYLKSTLTHGDLLVMHGSQIHKYYEHAADPYGKLRFALTSRLVLPERMKNISDAEAARIGGVLPYGTEERYAYNGGDAVVPPFLDWDPISEKLDADGWMSGSLENKNGIDGAAGAF